MEEQNLMIGKNVKYASSGGVKKGRIMDKIFGRKSSMVGMELRTLYMIEWESVKGLIDVVEPQFIIMIIE